MQARIIFGSWGTLITFGAIFSFIALYRTYPTENACWANDGTLLGSLGEASTSVFNCTYTCFENKQLLRSPTKLSILWKKRLFGHGFGLVEVSMGMTFFCGMISGIDSYVSIPQKKTEQELHAEIVNSSYTIGDTSDDRRRKQEDLQYAREELNTGEVPRRYRHIAFFDAVCFPIVIILNEIYLLQDGGLPCSESV